MSLKTQIQYAIQHPYKVSLTPEIFLGSKKELYKIIKIILFINPLALQDLASSLESCNTDLETLNLLKNVVMRLANRRDNYHKFAKYYGLDYQKDTPQIEKFIRSEVIRPLKIAFNRLVEQNQHKQLRIQFNQQGYEDQQDVLTDVINQPDWSYKKEKRAANFVADKVATILTAIVSWGQASIAAICFVTGGVASPLFWFTLLAGLVTNILLFRSDIKLLLKSLLYGWKFNQDVLSLLIDRDNKSLTFKERVLAGCLSIFAATAGFTFGVLALTTSYGSLVTLLTILGLGSLAMPAIIGAIASIISIATALVMFALMERALLNFMFEVLDNFPKIINYFNPKKHLQNARLKDVLGFVLSRSARLAIGALAIGITVFAVISTFGSYMSSISETMQLLFKISARLANIISGVVVFAFNLIPEVLFNFRNILNFFFVLPMHFKSIAGRASIVFQSDIHPAAKLVLFGVLFSTFVFLACVGFNGFGNGKMGSLPTGDGVAMLIKLFRLSPAVAAVIGLITSTSMSVACNETYGMAVLNRHTPVLDSDPSTDARPESTSTVANNRYVSFSRHNSDNEVVLYELGHDDNQSASQRNNSRSFL